MLVKRKKISKELNDALEFHYNSGITMNIIFIENILENSEISFGYYLHLSKRKDSLKNKLNFINETKSDDFKEDN